MKIKDYFILGCKLLGVYCLFLSVPHILNAVTTFFPLPMTSPDFEKIVFFERLITRIIPAIYLFIGIALIKNSEQIFSFAYRLHPEANFNLSPEKFRFFLKMLGMYLIANYFPALIKSISGYFTYTNASKVWDLITQRRYTSTNFFP